MGLCNVSDVFGTDVDGMIDRGGPGSGSYSHGICGDYSGCERGFIRVLRFSLSLRHCYMLIRSSIIHGAAECN